MPRKALMSADTTPSYLVVSRCGRRTFLIGCVPMEGVYQWMSSVLGIANAGLFYGTPALAFVKTNRPACWLACSFMWFYVLELTQ